MACTCAVDLLVSRRRTENPRDYAACTSVVWRLHQLRKAVTGRSTLMVTGEVPARCDVDRV